MRSLSSESFNRSAAPAELEYQVPVVQRSATASNEIANLIDSPPNWQHIWRQTASVVLDKVQMYGNHIEEANILPEKNKDSSVLPNANLQKVLPKESSAIPSVHPLAFPIGRNSGLFSIGEDFDDSL